MQAAIDAHGGLERWQAIDSLALSVSCGGIALALKGKPTALANFKASVQTRHPHVVLEGLGTFDANQPRPTGMARRMRWSTADVVHFGGYALWGYLATPFVFAEEDVSVKELSHRRLRVDFPARIPSHCTRQIFHFDAEGVLLALDYTAEVMLGRLSRARHNCLRYESVDGLLIATRRRVRPRGLPGPTLVSIAFDDIRTSPASPDSERA
jgi:hypothetical protein